jgi:hypothetical protein
MLLRWTHHCFPLTSVLALQVLEKSCIRPEFRACCVLVIPTPSGVKLDPVYNFTGLSSAHVTYFHLWNSLHDHHWNLQCVYYTQCRIPDVQPKHTSCVSTNTPLSWAPPPAGFEIGCHLRIGLNLYTRGGALSSQPSRPRTASTVPVTAGVQGTSAHVALRQACWSCPSWKQAKWIPPKIPQNPE